MFCLQLNSTTRGGCGFSVFPRGVSGFLVLLVCLVCRVAAVPIQSDSSGNARHSHAGLAPTGSPAAADVAQGCWIRGDRVQADELVHFRVAVKHSKTGLSSLEDAVLACSDPSSPQYGKHLSLDQVQNLVAPLPAALQAVRNWLGSAGVSPAGMHESSNGDFISAMIAAETVETLLGGVPLYRFQCAAADPLTSIIRTGENPRIPAQVNDFVDFVTPGFRFPATRLVRAPRMSTQQLAPTPTKEGVTPGMLRKLYNISTVGGKSSAKQAVASFLHNYFSPEDLSAFQRKFSPESQGETPTVMGPNDPSSPTLEASLDIQYLMSVAPAVPTEFWYTKGEQPHNPGAEPFVEFLAQVASTADAAVPKVFSISYADDENQVDGSYAHRVSVEFQKAAARGISLLVASGDCGVGGNTDQICHDKPFIPTFPASSPYITAIGGTWYHDPEIAFEISAGGFSNLFARPQYQNRSVRAYLHAAHADLPPKHRYNASGRAFPDLAAQSANFPIRVQGQPDAAYGTSAAVPVVAAVVALLNDERVAAGKSTLGFLNPLIYAAVDHDRQLFNDVTSGHNPGCGSQGFFAAPGWDPVTGAGTPDFGKWAAYVLSLP